MERLTDYHVGEKHAYMMCSGNCQGGLCENCEELEKIIDHLAAYEDTGLEPEEYKKHADAIKKLDIEHMHDLLQDEMDGRLVVLPCKVGDTLYSIFCGRIIDTKVRTFFIGHPSHNVEKRDLRMVRTDRWDIPMDEIGKTVFLTREEAEAALKNMKEA